MSAAHPHGQLCVEVIVSVLRGLGSIFMLKEMIKEEQEHPQMPCAVFCRTVPCPRVLHSAEPSCV